MAQLGRLILYTKRTEEMIAFYKRHFGYEAHRREGDRLVELIPKGPGLPLLLHPAAKGQKEGQSLIKLVFDVKDVAAFCAAAKAEGLLFGPIHHADGYSFANAKDPSNNSISVSERAFTE
ncbi:Glyoxalase/Bleomycin resistance protein/Dioxygenase superfamily protein [Poseidonocella pacifica]|uniref:Glyoxalase/Bleomycin resistance protein/Dioxygenase superfamily protein n=1 Tax=Poseidonocella pacifica TaxID=871651 RepID=A0A1I0V8Q6_9RHOB|nr:VOC family protein [Poseidonocella pacifica]SFA72749.1 Glyoxalase/Bleomycin resistance protein/Dioxygenase superfamily protein [Poseidonocella pacifica]